MEGNRDDGSREHTCSISSSSPGTIVSCSTATYTSSSGASRLLSSSLSMEARSTTSLLLDLEFICAKGTIFWYEKKANALSTALHGFLAKIRLSFHSPTSEEFKRIQRENNVVTLLLPSKKQSIWSTVEQIRAVLIEDANWSHPLTIPHAGSSSSVHEATRCIMGYIGFILSNYWTMALLLSEAVRLGKYEPQFGDVPHLDCMILEMVSCLEEKLACRSEHDPSLRFLFLLNNSHFILEKLSSQRRLETLNEHVARLALKVDDYMLSYLQASWAPVSSCLSTTSHTRPRFRRNTHSTLSSFKSEFERTWDAQKHWKVPDPILRMRLRFAITREVIPGYTKYTEDNKVEVTTKAFIAPQDLAEKLLQLFEGRWIYRVHKSPHVFI